LFCFEEEKVKEVGSRTTRRSKKESYHLEFPVTTTTHGDLMLPETSVELIKVILMNKLVLGHGTTTQQAKQAHKQSSPHYHHQSKQ
jgi:hypothetical protein